MVAVDRITSGMGNALRVQSFNSHSRTGVKRTTGSISSCVCVFYNVLADDPLKDFSPLKKIERGCKQGELINP